MQIDLTALPDDSTVLQSMVRDALTKRDTAEIEKLQSLIHKLLRHRFGRRSEQLSPDQLKLAMEDLEQEIAEREAAKDAAACCIGSTKPARKCWIACPRGCG